MNLRNKWQAIVYIARLLKKHLMATLVAGFSLMSISKVVIDIKLDNEHKFWLAIIGILLIFLIFTTVLGYCLLVDKISKK